MLDQRRKRWAEVVQLLYSNTNVLCLLGQHSTDYDIYCIWYDNIVTMIGRVYDILPDMASVVLCQYGHLVTRTVITLWPPGE